jgi:pimeloyl-ACP methyl ester carboxylesterase
MVSAADAEHFATMVPRGETARVAGAGHSVHRAQPDAFLALAVPFLRRHD